MMQFLPQTLSQRVSDGLAFEARGMILTDQADPNGTQPPEIKVTANKPLYRV